MIGDPQPGSSSSSDPGPGGPGPGGAQAHSAINRAIARALTKSEQITLVALKAEYGPALANREITSATLQDQLDRIAAARLTASQVTTATTGKRARTQLEHQARKELLASLAELISAAKQKFARSNPLRLADYFIGQSIDKSRADLEQFGRQIIDHAAADALPGITPAKLTLANQRHEAYRRSNVDQGSAQSDAAQLRRNLKDQVQVILDYRVTIQNAADAEWPHTTKTNAPIRREFQIPVRSRFVK
jgi:hypothetical protein